VDVALLEHSIRDDLNRTAPRVLCVLRPLRVVIENYPEGESEELDAPYFPEDVGKPGSRALPFSPEIWIERDDFAEQPPKGFHRLAPGREVRLRYAYLIRCVGVVKDEVSGEIVELRCTYDPATRGGAAPDGRRVPGTLHWVSARHALPVEVRLYDRLFREERPDTAADNLAAQLNPESLAELHGWIEPSVAAPAPGSHYQFERQGFFYLDPHDSVAGRRVFNRTVTLRDSWVKATERAAAEPLAPKAKPRAEPAPRRVAPADPLAGLDAAARTRAERYRDTLGLPSDQARLLAAPGGVAALFEAAVTAGAAPQAAAKWIVNELLRELRDRTAESLPFGGRELAELAALVEEGTISWTAGKEILSLLVERGGSPRSLVRERGLEQVADVGALSPLVERLLAENPDKVAAYRGGKTALLGWFVGQAMRASGGKANPQLVQELVRSRL